MGVIALVQDVQCEYFVWPSLSLQSFFPISFWVTLSFLGRLFFLFFSQSNSNPKISLYLNHLQLQLQLSPPGTGKTTTLVELLLQLVLRKGCKVWFCGFLMAMMLCVLLNMLISVHSIYSTAVCVLQGFVFDGDGDVRCAAVCMRITWGCVWIIPFFDV
jgi:hypothetical protein